MIDIDRQYRRDSSDLLCSSILHVLFIHSSFHALQVSFSNASYIVQSIAIVRKKEFSRLLLLFSRVFDDTLPVSSIGMYSLVVLAAWHGMDEETTSGAEKKTYKA